MILLVAFFVTEAAVERELAAIDREVEEEVLELIGAAFWFSALAAAAAASAAGLAIGLWGQRRLSAMSRVLARIAGGDLAARTAVLHDRDDLDRLASDIDKTASALERSLRQIKDQARMIAHDLRTPIARLRATLEDGLAAPGGVDGKDAALEAALAQADGIAQSFDALMRIAELESGARKKGFAAIDLEAIAREAAETFGPVIEDGGRRLVLDGCPTAPAIGDPKLILQLLANLIQNAIRHTEEGATVRLRAFERTLLVEDDGPGVPEGEREKILQPLYRLDHSRAKEGAGLGLALVKAISDLHEATLTLETASSGRGLAIRVVFGG